MVFDYDCEFVGGAGWELGIEEKGIRNVARVESQWVVGSVG